VLIGQDKLTNLTLIPKRNRIKIGVKRNTGSLRTVLAATGRYKSNLTPRLFFLKDK